MKRARKTAQEEEEEEGSSSDKEYAALQPYLEAADEEIPEDPEQWEVKVRGAKRLATNLAAEAAEARLYKKLAILRTDVPLEESLADLEWKGVPRETFEAFCEEMGYGRIANRPHRWAD